MVCTKDGPSHQAWSTPTKGKSAVKVRQNLRGGQLEKSPVAAPWIRSWFLTLGLIVDSWKGPGPLVFWQRLKPALFGRLNTEKKILVVIVICLLKEAGFGRVLEGKVGRQEYTGLLLFKFQRRYPPAL